MVIYNSDAAISRVALVDAIGVQVTVILVDNYDMC